MKVATIVGTRPEIIRLSRVISRFDNVFDHKLIHTGQNYDYELNEIFFDDLELRRPDVYLDVVGDSLGSTMGNIISRAYETLRDMDPDALLVLGDTNSALSAIAAKRLKIPVFHMEAGNRCFDECVPEEINRKIVDHISDINMPYSDISREYLLREGLPPDRIIKTGSPMFEVISYYSQKIDKFNFDKHYKIFDKIGLKYLKKKYFLMSFHREENVETENIDNFISLLLQLRMKWNDIPILISTHPRTRKRLESKGFNKNNENEHNIHLLNPLSFSDYIYLQIHSKAVLSDSGTLSEEASILKLNAINLRETHERPEANEEMPVIMTGLNLKKIFDAIEYFEKSKLYVQDVDDYFKSNVSEKVVKIIMSYTDYVNKHVWKKNEKTMV